MPKLAGPVAKYPARVSFLWYLGVILLGAAALLHPMCRGSGAPPIGLIDALFTATSATCVTGLATLNTETAFSPWGQVVILSLIQFGGIGILTFTTFITLRFGRRAGLRQRVLLSETLGARDNTDLQWVLHNVLIATLLIEGTGFLFLAARNLFTMSWQQALWHAAFHSVSAFCNAGFSLWGDNLSRYRSDITINWTIAALIMIGGLGFPVLLDVKKSLKGPWKGRWDRLHLHSKVMLLGTGLLLFLGTLFTLALEWDGVLNELPVGGRLMAAFFHSVSCRTAGFNTVDIGAMTNATLFITILLMMVGAGPCSTAGGFKVSTAMVMVLRAWSTFRGREKVNFFRRTIPDEAIEKAIATALLFSVVAIMALTMLLVFEQSAKPHAGTGGLFLDALFEVFSALGTVGLSTGITPELTDAGKIIIISLMFLGRLGPISVFAALSRSEKRVRVEYPGEEPMVG